MEQDIGEGREEERGRGTASDRGEGDECGDMTFVREGVLVQARGSIGDEGKVEK